MATGGVFWDACVVTSAEIFPLMNDVSISTPQSVLLFLNPACPSNGNGMPLSSSNPMTRSWSEPTAIPMRLSGGPLVRALTIPRMSFVGIASGATAGMTVG
jgi:hypothetical protein